MSHKNKQNLYMQANEIMKELFCPGASKHEAKQRARDAYFTGGADSGLTEKQYIDRELQAHIFSYKTYATYAKHQHYFLDWCRENYGCKQLSDCRSHADEWLKQREAEGKSAYTLKLETAAIAKVFKEPSTNFYKTEARVREKITRSRGTAKRDYGFNIANNAEIINFARGTGLRRSELESLTGKQLVEVKAGEYRLMIKGKGGRVRMAPIVGPHAQQIIDKCKASGDGLVWGKAPSHMDVHSYRSDYATAIYKAYERDISSLSQKEKYFCRSDRKGTCFDRQALKEASEALGHSRVSVVAEHYIR